MKLPKSLIGLTGPSTPDTQKVFLRDLKQAFRDRVEHQAPPIKSSINRHLQNIFDARQPKQAGLTGVYRDMRPGDAARRLYIEGHLTKVALHELLSRSTTKGDLETINKYSTKAGVDLVNRPTNLSARYAAKLLHLGSIEEVRLMIERHTMEWIDTPSAHPVLLQYTCRTEGGLAEAKIMFDHLIEHDARNLTTPLVRTLLRESIRGDSVQIALECLRHDMRSATGQEAGLARWLNARHRHEVAFTVLSQADPARTKEGAVGLEIARSMMDSGLLPQAKVVLAWVERRYALSLQPSLRAMETELSLRLGEGESESPSVGPVPNPQPA